VRAALGVAQINLMGVSYGTRVRSSTPSAIRSTPAPSPSTASCPNSLVLGNEHARNLERSLDSQFKRCRSAPGCVQKLGDPRAQLNAVMAQAEGDPPMVSLPRRDHRREQAGAADARARRRLARMFAYAPQAAGLLPLELNEAAQGRYEPLMALSKLLSSTIGDQIMHGMQLSVICTEDASELKADPPTPAA
jgi:hypothetical protein